VIKDKLHSSIIGTCLLLVLLTLVMLFNVSLYAVGFIVFGVPLIFVAVFFWNEVINSTFNP